MRSFICNSIVLAGTHSACFFAGKYQGAKGNARELKKPSYTEITSNELKNNLNALGFLLAPTILLTEVEGAVSMYLFILLMAASHPIAYQLGKHQGMLEYEEKQASITPGNGL